MNNKAMYKMISLILMLLLFMPFSLIFYFGLYSISNHYPETYQRYATDGKYERNVFFSNEINEDTNVIHSINCVDFTEAIEDGRIQTVCKKINENKNDVRKSLMSNEKYMNYLKDNELTIDDFFSYTKKISDLDDTFFKASFFLLWLIIIYICVVKLGWRSKFYLFSGGFYILNVLSKFTGRQSDNLLYYSFFSHYDTYDNYISTVPILFEALIESILTFIIFDYLFQNYGNKRKIVISNCIDELNIMVDKIESRTITPLEIKNSWDIIILKTFKMCEKYISKYDRNQKSNKIFKYRTKFDEKKYLLICDIQKKINDIRCSNTTNINGYNKKIRSLRGMIISLQSKYY